MGGDPRVLARTVIVRTRVERAVLVDGDQGYGVGSAHAVGVAEAHGDGAPAVRATTVAGELPPQFMVKAKPAARSTDEGSFAAMR